MKLNNDEIMSFLKELGLEELDQQEKEMLVNRLEKANSLGQVKGELELLFVLNKLLISSYQKVNIENMYKISDNLDAAVAIKLFMEYQNIKSKSKDKFTCLQKFKDVVEEILIDNKKVSKKVVDAASLDASKILLQESLYMTMLDKSKADKLLNNCIRRSSHFLSKCDGENLRKLIECLKTNFNLSENELVKISSRCATFFTGASASKISSLSRTLNNFKDFIANRISLQKNKEGLQLLNREFKDVLINSSLIATKDSSTVNETVKFLMGQKAGDIIKVDGAFAKLKGEFTPDQLAKIYDKSITSLGMGVEHIVDFTRDLNAVFKKVYGREINIEGFINGKNFSSLSRLSKKDYEIGGKLEDILSILSNFFNAQNMENLLKNNVGFLECELVDVHRGLKEALMESNDKEGLRKNILAKVKNSFGINEGEFVDVERRRGIGSSKIAKVEINDVKEENMEQLLTRFGVENQEREKWRSNWNKERKEYKNLEIEIALEELLSQLESVKELVPYNVIDKDEFIEETDTIKELTKDIEKKYDEIILNNKLNKKLQELAISVQLSIMDINGLLENNYNKIIEYYNKQIELMTLQLENDNKIKEALIKKLEQALALEVELQEEKISEEYIKEYSKDQSALEHILKNSISLCKKNEKLYNKYKYDLADVAKIFKYIHGDEVRGNNFIKGPKSALSGEDMFMLLNKVFYKEGLIEKDSGDIVGVSIPSYEEFLCMLNEIEAKCVGQLKNQIENYNRINKSLVDHLVALFANYGYEGKDVKDVKSAMETLYSLVEQSREVLSNAKQKMSQKLLLENEIKKIDLEELEQREDELKLKIEEYVKKINKIKKKNNQ